MVIGEVISRENIQHNSDDSEIANSVSVLCGELKQQTFVAGQLLRLEHRIPALDLLAWLQNNPDDDTVYWASRDKAFTLSGIGVTKTFVADAPDAISELFHRIKTLLHNQSARFVGGIGFNPESLKQEWKEHPFAQFVLPQIEVAFRDDEHWLAVNILADNALLFTQKVEQAIQRLHSLVWNCESSCNKLMNVSVLGCKSTPDREQWTPLFNDALTAIESARLDKIVLSREVQLTLSGAVSATDILQQWSRKNSHSYTFCLQSSKGAFLGCSPEQLFSRVHCYLNTEAIAGTVRRGESPQCDANLAEHLTHDPKLLREHKVVVDYIVRQLSDLSEVASVQAPLSILKLAKVQHLQVPLKARLKPNVDDSDILLKLHPTPAVCGNPRQAAMDFIDQHELAPRGWYAGAVGVIADSETEFSVAIRSVLLKEQSVYCYSGVGLVKGSEEQAEWLELDVKIETLLSLFKS